MVDITVKLFKPIDVEKGLKLITTLSTSNMNLFGADEHLYKYATVHDIIDAFYEVRLQAYEKRKSHQMKVLQETMHKLHHKVKYIKAILTDQLDLRRKTQDQIVDEFKRLHIEEHEGYNYLTKMPMDSVSNEKVLELTQEHDTIEKEMKELTETSIEKMWIRELLLLKKNS